MNKAVKIHLMYGPLSYLDSDEARNLIDDHSHLDEERMSEVYAPDFYDFKKGCEKDFTEYLHKKAMDNLHYVQIALNKKVKKWIKDETYSVIYFFHPSDIAGNPDDYKELEKEVKKKDITLVSVYHTLKDFKFLSTEEAIEKLDDYNWTGPIKYLYADGVHKINTFMGAEIHRWYKLFIENYNIMEEPNPWGSFEEILASEKYKGGE